MRQAKRKAMDSQLKNLLPGQTYFIVMFHDEDLKVPLVQTLIFIKDGRRPDGSEFFLFRELTPHGGQSKFVVDKKDAKRVLLDQAGLLRKLKSCFDGKLATTPP
jgi:hypothetical protein